MNIFNGNAGFLDLTELPSGGQTHRETADWIDFVKRSLNTPDSVYFSDKGANFNQIVDNQVGKQQIYVWSDKEEPRKYHIAVYKPQDSDVGTAPSQDQLTNNSINNIDDINDINKLVKEIKEQIQQRSEL